MGKSLISDSARAWTGVGLNPNSEFGIVLVLVVGALGFRDRKETDVLQLICSVSLIAKRSGFSRTRTTTSTRTTPQIRNSGLKLLRIDPRNRCEPRIQSELKTAGRLLFVKHFGCLQGSHSM